jgi:hypothetical protein
VEPAIWAVMSTLSVMTDGLVQKASGSRVTAIGPTADTDELRVKDVPEPAVIVGQPPLVAPPHPVMVEATTNRLGFEGETEVNSVDPEAMAPGLALLIVPLNVTVLRSVFIAVAVEIVCVFAERTQLVPDPDTIVGQEVGVAHAVIPGA